MAKALKSPAVDKYIKDFPAKTQTILKKFRQLVRQLSPDAVESMSYGLVGYKLNGKPLAYFGGWKSHIGFYATPAGNAAFKKELSKYAGAKGSVKFPLTESIPYSLVTRMIKYKVKENTGSSKKKVAKKTAIKKSGKKSK